MSTWMLLKHAQLSMLEKFYISTKPNLIHLHSEIWELP